MILTMMTTMMTTMTMMAMEDEKDWSRILCKKLVLLACDENYLRDRCSYLCRCLYAHSCPYPRIDFEDGQWGCEPQLGMRVANKVDIVNEVSGCQEGEICWG